MMLEIGESLEGFLCPVCRSNFRTDNQLLTHYQDEHSEHFFKSVKDIYKKAKQKILLKDILNINIESEENIGKSLPGYTRSEENNEIGSSKNHTEFYKAFRTTKMEHYAAQTNNLIIRLERLLLNLPSDPVKRKVHEQDIVPWINEKDVKLCPGCAKSFNLLRRKHHCRLCGSIMCNECTFLLQLDTAREITNNLIASDVVEEGKKMETSEKEENQIKSTQKTLTSMKFPSSATIQSVLSLDLAGEPFFRVCEHCYKLLEMRQKLKEVRNQKPIICQFYKKMKASMDEINVHHPTYMKMLSSLSIGETLYNLQDAELLRIKILKAAENVDLLSNKISILGQNSENPPTGNELALQKAIHTMATNFLKEKIVSLPSLPKEEQIKKAQEQRSLEIAKRIEEENRLEMLAVTEDDTKVSKSLAGVQSSSKNEKNFSTSSKEVLVEDGWTPEISQSAFGIISDHPIIQQINIIKGYIKQAKSAQRMGEVSTLQQNLRDLEEEFWRLTKEEYVEGPKV